MTGAWMCYAVLISAVAYVSAAIADYLLWMWRGPRRVAWLIAVVVATVAPLALPAWRAASRTAPVAVPLTQSSPRQHLPTLPFSAPKATANRVDEAPGKYVGAPSARDLIARVERAASATWLAVSTVLLLLAFTSYLRLERQSASWTEADIDGTRVAVTSHCGPAVFGIWRPRIVIPRWALGLDVRARTLMLAHECEHVKARDSQYLLMAMLAAVLLPWNAALWLIVRRLRLAMELDCDDRVLRAHGDAAAYGALLLTVCARRRGDMPFALALAERPSMLERRIRAMTASMPRQRLLISLPLLLSLTVLTVAAMRAPSPSLPLRDRSGDVSKKHPARADAPSSAQPTGVLARAVEPTMVMTATRARPLPRLASPESLPRISANWENARIEDVVAAFAAFAHRRITTAPDVDGLITATVVDQPWREALQTIAAQNALRVEFRSDSSVYISPLPRSQPRSPGSMGPQPMSRNVSGIVSDAETGAPIAGARINVVGVQLLDGPNETSTNQQGHFSLRVPDGEVWLDACAAGYEIGRVTLAARDTIAEFQARRSVPSLPLDTVRLNRADIESVEIIKGPASGNGVIQITMKNGAAPTLLSRNNLAVRGVPLFVIDGLPVNGTKPSEPSCGRVIDLGYRVQFKLF